MNGVRTYTRDCQTIRGSFVISETQVSKGELSLLSTQIWLQWPLLQHVLPQVMSMQTLTHSHC